MHSTFKLQQLLNFAGVEQAYMLASHDHDHVKAGPARDTAVLCLTHSDWLIVDQEDVLPTSGCWAESILSRVPNKIGPPA